MMMDAVWSTSPLSRLLLIFFCFLVVVLPQIEAHHESGALPDHSRFVKKEHRKILSSSESGQVSYVKIGDAYGRNYQLHFFSLEPSSLFLPVILHSDMVFFVQTGRGNMGWIEESEMQCMTIEEGEVFRLPAGSVFYVSSEPSEMRRKLRLHAIFTNSNDEIAETHTGTYSSLTDLVLGFDRKILRTAFRVSDEVMEALAGGRRPPAIVPMQKKEEDEWKDGLNWVNRMVESLAENGLLGLGGHHHKKDKKHKPFNIFKKKPDFSNFYGWSLAIDHKEFHALKDSNIGLFMVNLTKGSMMGPHWNPKATEIAIVTYGEGMVQIVAPNETDRCGVRRFKVSEGDVFATSRYEPMAQMSYDNDSLVFMGFSTMSKRNHPQFLAGSSSVLQTLGESVVSLSLNANRSDVRQLLSSQADAIILACPYCAVEEEKLMKEEEERQREKEWEREKEEEEEEKREREKEREEEEARKKREEEAEEKWEREKEREEEEARKRREEEEEEERREREEEEREGEREAREEEEEGRGWRKKLVFKGRREWN
ncbi:vicilin-like seed storage protein At2g18540 [Nymphaea colorata]|nr:vicilin-like seed storage protein At2g18540 [Nymphaea colorata]